MGYTGKYLDVDLSTGKIKINPVPWDWLRDFLGGKGLGAKILLEELPPKLDPLSPDSLLILLTGPLTGTTMPSSGRWAIVVKSPHTGTFNDSHIGGNFGAKLKKAGFDFVIIRGKAPKPVYLHIFDGGAEIKDATDLWGKRIFEVDDILHGRYKDASVGVIGPAGENLVTFACISFDKGRQAGRGGTGTVMGSKNLKALVVQGTGGINYHDADGFRQLVVKLNQKLRKHPVRMKRHKIGTLNCIWEGIDGGVLPFYNYGGKWDARIIELVPQVLIEKGMLQGKRGCYSCPFVCTNYTRIPKGEYAGKTYEVPEYEPTALFGCNLGIFSYEDIVYAHTLCNDLGVDAISMANITGFAMECYERGLISSEIPLHWGNGDAMIEFIKSVAYKRGIGELFTGGVKRAAAQIGKGSEKFAIHVKGLEIAGVDPRASWGMALAFATADRGGCHQRAWTARAELYGKVDKHSPEQLAHFVRYVQDERAAAYSLVVCDFMPISEDEFAELITKDTGFEMGADDYVKLGERIWNLVRIFNLREGFTRKDDTLPARFFEEHIEDGPAKGEIIPRDKFEKMLDLYYEIRGWNKEGVPTESKLNELGLSGLSDELH